MLRRHEAIIPCPRMLICTLLKRDRRRSARSSSLPKKYTEARRSHIPFVPASVIPRPGTSPPSFQVQDVAFNIGGRALLGICKSYWNNLLSVATAACTKPIRQTFAAQEILGHRSKNKLRSIEKMAKFHPSRLDRARPNIFRRRLFSC